MTVYFKSFFTFLSSNLGDENDVVESFNGGESGTLFQDNAKQHSTTRYSQYNIIHSDTNYWFSSRCEGFSGTITKSKIIKIISIVPVSTCNSLIANRIFNKFATILGFFLLCLGLVSCLKSRSKNLGKTLLKAGAISR